VFSTASFTITASKALMRLLILDAGGCERGGDES
jgi:hypothetical protein